LSIELQNNYQQQTFFEYGNHTYDGTQLAETIKTIAIKNGR